MAKWLFSVGALLGFLAVSAGAFGAHALKNRLSQEMLNIFEVGVRYQMYHALAICFVASLSLVWPGWFFFFGTLIFSGSLYLLALTRVRIFGAVTPIGGVVLLIGWLLLILYPLIKQT